ncbi:MAG: SDR family oxidoreductase [Gallicola sp.]|nr:SDR family oxidoreductase [Gallicola sp.]
MGKLDGKVAIITGSTSGMGRETAYLFAKEGAKVVITGRNEERSKEAVQKIKDAGGEAIYVLVDMTDLKQVENIFDETIKAYGTVDILYNNAGMLSTKNTLDIELEEFLNVFNVNVNAALVLTKKCAPVMKEKGKGVIINTGSVAGTSARWGSVAYCSSKHAMSGLTKAFARELGPEIRCNAILPGAIQTAMLDSVGGADAMEPMRQMSPLKTLGEGLDIANTALFLASDESRFITGQLLRVDGGIDC